MKNDQNNILKNRHRLESLITSLRGRGISDVEIGLLLTIRGGELMVGALGAPATRELVASIQEMAKLDAAATPAGGVH